MWDLYAVVSEAFAVEFSLWCWSDTRFEALARYSSTCMT
jgi:hypothetical protein